MQRSKKETFVDSCTEKLPEVEKKIFDTLEVLTTKVDTSSSRLVKSDNPGEEIKLSSVECLQPCQVSLETSVQNKKDIPVLKTGISKQRYENAHSKTKISRIEDQITRIESQSHTDNLLIDGLDERENEKCTAKVRQMFKQDMKLNDVDNIKVVRCHRLQNKRRGQTSSTIIVKFGDSESIAGKMEFKDQEHLSQ